MAAIYRLMWSIDRFGETALIGYFDYLTRMASSKIAVSVRGFGWDTCRYWEAPFCSVMLCDELEIKIPNDFEHEKTCLRYTDANSCADQVKQYLKKPELLAEIRAAGLEHAKKYHTNKRRVEYMFDRLDMDYTA